MSKNTIGLPAESPEAIAERLLPCVDAGNCGEWGHYDDCPVNLRPAIATALQAEQEDREYNAKEFSRILGEHKGRIFELATQLQAERERALEEVLQIIDKIGHEYAGGFISDCLNDLEDRIRRALAQKGGG